MGDCNHWLCNRLYLPTSEKYYTVLELRSDIANIDSKGTGDGVCHRKNMRNVFDFKRNGSVVRLSDEPLRNIHLSVLFGS